MNSRYFRDLVLRHTLLDAAVVEPYMSLHVGEPGEIGVAELAGEGYERQPLELARSAPGTVTNQNGVEFRDLPAGLVTHFGVWDARTGGNYLSGGPLMVPHQLYLGNNLGWREAEIVLRVG